MHRSALREAKNSQANHATRLHHHLAHLLPPTTLHTMPTVIAAPIATITVETASSSQLQVRSAGLHVAC